MKFKSSNISEEDGKYYRIDIKQCKDCTYCETTKTEITEQEVNGKTDLTGSFITSGEYFSKVETHEYPVTYVRRTHTVKDVPNDKRLFGYSLTFVGDGKEDVFAESHFFTETDGDVPFLSLVDDVYINCEKIEGTNESDYKFTMDIRNPEYKYRDFKVTTVFTNVTTIYAEEGKLYTTSDNSANGEQTWTGNRIDLSQGDVVYYQANEVITPNKVLTGLSKIDSAGETANLLDTQPVVDDQHDLYKITTNIFTSGDITVKSTYEINNGSKYTVGFDHDNDTSTPTIDLPGPFTEGTELTIPSAVKYYGTIPTGHYFSHWVCAQMAGEYIPNETFNVVSENMVFTPVYLPVPPKTINIAYNDEMEGVMVDVPYSSSIYAGQTYTIDSKVPELTGYEFKGWSTKAKVTSMSDETLAMYQPGTEIKVSETNNFVIFRAVWEEKGTAKAENNLLSVEQETVKVGTVYIPKVSYTGDTPNGGVVELSYKLFGADDSTYSSVKPTEVGNYTVKATSAETETVLAKSVTANFSIIALTTLTQDLKFAQKIVEKKYGDAVFTNTLTGTFSKVNYSSNNTSVATVDSNGAVTIVGAGTVIITAKSESFEKDGKLYASEMISYMLNVAKASTETPDKDIPQTGDNSNTMIYIILALVSLTGVGMSIFKRKIAK